MEKEQVKNENSDKNPAPFLSTIYSDSSNLWKNFEEHQSVWYRAKNQENTSSDKKISLFSKESKFTKDEIKKHSIRVEYGGKTYYYSDSKKLANGLADTMIQYNPNNSNKFTITLNSDLVEPIRESAIQDVSENSLQIISLMKSIKIKISQRR
jgi:YHS domain-containing protein